MNKYKYLVFFLMLLFLVSCNRSQETDDKRIITVSIQPFSYFVESIAGDKFTINVLVPPGASPATYEPTPSAVRDLNDSDLLLLNGYLGYEQAWMKKIISVNSGVNVLNLSDNQNLIAASRHKHGDHYHLSGVDPHYWLSTLNAAVIADDILESLISIDPVNSSEYRENYNRLMKEILEVEEYISARLSGQEGLSFMIFHPALGYIARDFGLIQIPVEIEGKEPSPSAMKSFIDIGRKNDIKTIFVQREFDIKNARTISEEMGAEIVIIDPLSSDWSSTLKQIADLLVGDKSLNN